MATTTELTVGAKVWRKGQPSEVLARHRERGCCGYGTVVEISGTTLVRVRWTNGHGNRDTHSWLKPAALVKAEG